MEKEELMQYRKLKKEAESLANRIDKLRDRDIPVVAGKVKASSKEFPFTENRVSVQMYEPGEASRVDRLLRIYRERKEQAEKSMLQIEEYIDGIQDTELRQIFQMRFIDGMKLREIADGLCMDLTGISKKITGYLQLSKKSKKSVV